MSARKIVIDTDILLGHLVGDDEVSLLRRVMNEYFCYTTVFNAIEAFSVARSESEIQAVDDAMSSMKVLGLSAKSAKSIGRTFSQMHGKSRSDLAALIAGVCIESKLPIVTMNPKRYSGVKQLQVVPAKKLLRPSRAAEIFSH